MKNNLDNLTIVTVAMVTYNSAAYIRHAIESVLASSYPNFELVISDDCSTDDTWEIVKSYKDDRIVTNRNPQNIGEYANRNICVELAKGEFLLFIDGDDMIYPHGLEFMVKMLMKFPQCGMALMRWYKKNIFYPVVISPYQFYIESFFNDGYNNIALSNVLFRTQLLKKMGGFSTKFKSGDSFIRLKFGAIYDTLLINDGLTWWRETPNQASSFIKLNYKFLIENFNISFSSLSEKSCPLNEKEIELAKINLNTKILQNAFQLLKNGKIKNAILLLREFKIPLYKIIKYRRKCICKDPLENYTPSKPYMISLSNSPFTNSNFNSEI